MLNWIVLNRTDYLYKNGKTPFNECAGYDAKQSDGEVIVMLEFWRMRSTP